MRRVAQPFWWQDRDGCRFLLEDRGQVRLVLDKVTVNRGCRVTLTHVIRLSVGVKMIAWIWNGYAQPEVTLKKYGFGQRRELSFRLTEGEPVGFHEVLCAQASLFRGARTAPKQGGASGGGPRQAGGL